MTHFEFLSIKSRKSFILNEQNWVTEGTDLLVEEKKQLHQLNKNKRQSARSE